ncbi:hypothetical protein [Paenibacillus sp. NPDC057934]|uniref:hypothetical protein n=1 Tax=Paenibacillus sp. NPDC057934 TaxID=3346282 RepID=UPI0036DDEF7B
MLKKTISFLAILTISSSLSLSAFAAQQDEENITFGTWSRGEITQDSVPPFSGTITDSSGNTTTLSSSPFNSRNIISNEQIVSTSPGNGLVSTNNWWNGNNTLYYEYVNNSFTQTSYSNDPYHFLVGQTQTYNGTSSNSTLAYTQANTVTSTWSVTAQVSSTAELKSNYFTKLNVTLGGSYTTSNTTSSSTTILNSIQASPGKTGYIKAYLPGGYSYGTAKYKEYNYYSSTGSFVATGNTVTTNEGGWAPPSSTSYTVLNFSTGQN